ncbi:hypothetical protein EZV62_024075 [Acer yangbiense]|uniref:CCHC-type domain-containing protein n=1 Tax=Acer yangbiense TaxID=1000413 RepID=A0A5C7H3R3_9ROSI|nr:hypothetical protein EZV62_024075 [Acer yangbiense]
MDPDEITRLCASMSIHSNNEKLWSVKDSLKEATGKKLNLRLVGKVLTNKHVNREAFRLVIPRIWQTSQGFDIKVAFWVQIHNAPLLCMMKEMREFLGQFIGEVVDIDVGSTGECFGKYLRVRVAIDVSKPLKRFLRLDLDEKGAESMVLIRYEKLPEYCFSCGLLGHAHRECQLGRDGAMGNTKLEFDYEVTVQNESRSDSSWRSRDEDWRGYGKVILVRNLLTSEGGPRVKGLKPGEAEGNEQSVKQRSFMPSVSGNVATPREHETTVAMDGMVESRMSTQVVSSGVSCKQKGESVVVSYSKDKNVVESVVATEVVTANANGKGSLKKHGGSKRRARDNGSRQASSSEMVTTDKNRGYDGGVLGEALGGEYARGVLVSGEDGKRRKISQDFESLSGVGSTNGDNCMQRVINRLSSCSKSLQMWNGRNNWNLRKDIVAKKKELASVGDLNGHGLRLEVCYLFCSKQAETTLHALWRCFKLKGIRAACRFSYGGSSLDSGSFMDFVISVGNQVTVQEFETLCVTW